jgi:hypothetical protein
VVDGRFAFDHALPGTNGRSCATCHVASEHRALVPANVEERFQLDPFDPLFNRLDADDPTAPHPTYEHLRKRALVRVTFEIAANLDVIDEEGNAHAEHLGELRAARYRCVYVGYLDGPGGISFSAHVASWGLGSPSSKPLLGGPPQRTPLSGSLSGRTRLLLHRDDALRREDYNLTPASSLLFPEVAAHRLDIVIETCGVRLSNCAHLLDNGILPHDYSSISSSGVHSTTGSYPFWRQMASIWCRVEHLRYGCSSRSAGSRRSARLAEYVDDRCSDSGFLQPAFEALRILLRQDALARDVRHTDAANPEHGQ